MPPASFPSPETAPVATQIEQMASRAELHCASCGYGVAVLELPTACPMCRQTVWRRAENLVLRS